MIFPSIHLLFWDPLGSSHPPVILQSSSSHPTVVPVSSPCRPGVVPVSKAPAALGASAAQRAAPASGRHGAPGLVNGWKSHHMVVGMSCWEVCIYIYMYHMGCKETKLIIWLMFRMSELRFFFGSGDLFHYKRCAARFKFRQMIVPTGRMLTQ